MFIPINLNLIFNLFNVWFNLRFPIRLLITQNKTNLVNHFYEIFISFTFMIFISILANFNIEFYLQINNIS